MENLGVIIVIAMAMGFNYTNGFHDAANAIATSVSTRALTPRVALAMAAVMNLLGSFFGAKVAKTVGQGHRHAALGHREPRGGLRRADRRDRLEPHHLVVRPAVVLVVRAHSAG